MWCERRDTSNYAAYHVKPNTSWYFVRSCFQKFRLHKDALKVLSACLSSRGWPPKMRCGVLLGSKGGRLKEGVLYYCLCFVFTPWRPVFWGWPPKGRCTVLLFVFCFYSMEPCVLRVAAQRKVHCTIVCVLFLRHGTLCFEGGHP